MSNRLVTKLFVSILSHELFNRIYSTEFITTDFVDVYESQQYKRYIDGFATLAIPTSF